MKKKDQAFFELVAAEYNSKGVSTYDLDAYPHLKKGRSIPPSHFQPIDWKKCMEVFKAICNDYDVCFKHWVSNYINVLFVFYYYYSPFFFRSCPDSMVKSRMTLYQ